MRHLESRPQHKSFSPIFVQLGFQISPENTVDLPSNLLDDLTDESGALAQVALGAGDTGLDDTAGGFL